MNVKFNNFFWFSCLVLTAFFISCNKKNSKIEHLKTFATVYGYVKYFHPSDEAFELDWGKFAIYGSQEVLKCKTQSELKETLERIFTPIAPTIAFSTSIISLEQAISKAKPDQLNYKEIYWSHVGVGTGMKQPNSAYQSNRILVDKSSDTLSYRPRFGEAISTEIGVGLNCLMPITLYSNQSGTFPNNERPKANEFIKNLKEFEVNTNSISFRIGNIINTYNVFQYFYPYFDVVKVDWTKQLEKAIEQSFQNKNRYEHSVTLEKFLAPLKDGHISVTARGFSENYDLPVSWEWFEDKLILTEVWNDSLNVKIGDEVTQINGSTSKDYFNEIESRISAGTEGWLLHMAYQNSIKGRKDSKLSINTDEKKLELIRNSHTYDIPRLSKEAYDDLGSGIHYINMSLMDMETFEYLIPILEKCEGIIFDLRGYPNQNHQILSYFIKENDTLKQWLRTPIVVRPNKFDAFKKHDFVLEAKEPFLGSKKVVFLTDGAAISYAESVMNFVKGFKIGTIIGQPTAGANGNFNSFWLPGNIEIKFTGMRAYKHNGELFHCKGVLPDIYVTKTKEGLIQGRDEYLEKAIEIIEQQ